MIVDNEGSQIMKVPKQTNKPSAYSDSAGNQKGDKRLEYLGGECGEEVRHFLILLATIVHREMERGLVLKGFVVKINNLRCGQMDGIARGAN